MRVLIFCMLIISKSVCVSASDSCNSKFKCESYCVTKGQCEIKNDCYECRGMTKAEAAGTGVGIALFLIIVVVCICCCCNNACFVYPYFHEPMLVAGPPLIYGSPLPMPMYGPGPPGYQPSYPPGHPVLMHM